MQHHWFSKDVGTKFNQTPDGSESWTTNRDNLQRLQREIDSQKAMKFVERAGGSKPQKIFTLLTLRIICS